MAHGSQADALVLVFARGLARGDTELLADFQGAGLATATPITAVGAFTKVELYWPEHDPMTEGRRVAGKMMTEAGASRLLFELRPVASLVGAGAATLTEDECGDLAELGRLAPDLLASRVARGPLFTSRDYDDMPVPATRRRALFRKLGGYGIVLSCGSSGMVWTLARDCARSSSRAAGLRRSSTCWPAISGTTPTPSSCNGR